MFITKKAVARRTVLRGMGATLALPLLDAMVPALTAIEKTAGTRVPRFGAIYVPNGMAMRFWTPKGEGDAFEFGQTLQAMAPHRDCVMVLTGLNGPRGGDHAGGSTGFLTGLPNGWGLPGPESLRKLRAGISLDQIVAKELGQQTPIASLELAVDEATASCDVLNCAYDNTISWRGETTPLPMEINPRVVFERMFGDNGATDPAARRARLEQNKSILDSVMQRVADFERGIGGSDRTKMAEYLDGVRDIERRIQAAEVQHANLPTIDQPAGVPATYPEHVRLMFDLQLLAYRSDMTRVGTFMLGREVSGRTYRELGVPEAHHPLSHHLRDEHRYASLAKINAYHVSLFAEYVEKLKATPDGNGSLLDHTILLYGAGMSDSNDHDHENVPLMLVGGGARKVKGGRHITFNGQLSAKLLLTIADKLGVALEHLGEAHEKLDLDTLSGV